MNTIYEVLENEYIKKTIGDIVWFIPNDPANADYQEYLKSLEIAAATE